MKTRLKILSFAASVLIMFGCGGGGSNSRSPQTASEPIPRQLYRADLTKASNTCGAVNKDIVFLVMPQPDGSAYAVGGLGPNFVPAILRDDHFTFSADLPTLSGGTITFAADWVFAPGRHTFSGTSTAEFKGATPCTFTFSAAGQHIDSSGNPVNQTGAAHLDASTAIAHAAATVSANSLPRAPTRHTSAVVGAENYWGFNVGRVFLPSSQPCNHQDATNVTPSGYLIIVSDPNIRARGSLREQIFFKFSLRFANSVPDLAASVDLLGNVGGTIEANTAAYDQWWFGAQVNPEGSLSFLDVPPDYVGWGPASQFLFQASPSPNERTFVPDFGPAGAPDAGLPRYYYGILDVYWAPSNSPDNYDNGQFESYSWGWTRQIHFACY